MRYRLPVKKPPIFVLLALISTASVSAVLYTPSLPEIAQVFGVSIGATQWTVTIFLISYAIGQLIYAPIANKLGRKPTLYIGLSVAFLGSLLCAMAGTPFHSFAFLVFARLIQALGASVGLVLTLTIINDFYYPEDARKITAYTTTAFAIMPGLSVTLGGILTEHFGWASNFYFLTMYFFIVILSVGMLPETYVASIDAHKSSGLLKRYMHAFGTFRITGYAVLVGSTTAIIYLFSANAPVIAINALKISPSMFGFMNLFPAVLYFLGNLATGRWSTYFAPRKVIFIAIFAIASMVALLLFFVYQHRLNFFILFIPIGVIYFFIPAIWSNSSVIAVSPHQDKASASSVVAFINMFTATCAVLFASLIHGGVALFSLMIFIFSGIIFLMFFFFFVLKKYTPMT